MDQGEEETWDTVGGATERSRNLAPTTEVTMPEAAQQAVVANESWASAKGRRPEPSSTSEAEELGEPMLRKRRPQRLELLILPAYLAL
jgi:hypothetical protein